MKKISAASAQIASGRRRVSPPPRRPPRRRTPNQKVPKQLLDAVLALAILHP